MNSSIEILRVVGREQWVATLTVDPNQSRPHQKLVRLFHYKRMDHQSYPFQYGTWMQHSCMWHDE